MTITWQKNVPKRIRLESLGLGRAFLLASPVLAGCSKQTNPSITSTSALVVILASNERGRPQFDYSGPDSLNYKYFLGTFTFQIGQWATVKGEMKLGGSNDVTITTRSKKRLLISTCGESFTPTTSRKWRNTKNEDRKSILAGSSFR
jgi:hypothetical protein